MKPANLTSILALILSLAAPSVGSAQSSLSLVTVLAFTDSTGGDGTTAGQLYNSVRAQIELHRDYSLNDVPPQTLEELLLALGCASLDAECSTLVAEIVESEFLAWGEIVANEQRLGVRMVLWNLEAAEEVRAVAHFLDVESTTTLMDFAAVIGRSLLYEAGEELTVSSTPVGATVFVDGEERGVTPLMISDVALGLYEVELVADGYRSGRSTVVVDLGGGRVQVTLEVQQEERTTGTSSEFADAAPWILVGSGSAMIVAGAVFGVQSKSTQREFDDVVAAEVLDRERAEEIQATGESQATLSNVFIGLGAAVAVGGVIMRIVRGPADTEAEPAPWARVGGYVGAGGGGMVLTFTR
jgi:hypothetical protein